MVAATAHKGLVELEVTPQQTVDASEAASFSAAASDASSAAKVGHWSVDDGAVPLVTQPISVVFEGCAQSMSAWEGLLCAVISGLTVQWFRQPHCAKLHYTKMNLL